MLSEDTIKIRTLNDRFRQGDVTVPGEVYITQAVQALAEEGVNCSARDTAELVAIVRNYGAFTSESDPHGEHDFGYFQYKGETCFWKIDTYDHALKHAAPDPTNPKLSKRVLTIMLASEY